MNMPTILPAIMTIGIAVTSLAAVETSSLLGAVAEPMAKELPQLPRSLPEADADRDGRISLVDAPVLFFIYFQGCNVPRS